MSEETFDLKKDPDETLIDVKTITKKVYTVYIDEIVNEASYYRKLFNIMRDANTEDEIHFIFNSPGGYVDTMSQLAYYLTSTKATTVAEVHQACSAASFAALHCDKIEVKKHGYMMFHSLISGVFGKAGEMKSAADFLHKQDKLYSEVNKNFLTAKELSDIENGMDIFIDEEECNKRLKGWVSLRKRTAEIPAKEKKK